MKKCDSLFLTPFERETKRRNAEICEFYLRMLDDYPDIAYNRIHIAIADKFNISREHARKVVVTNLTEEQWRGKRRGGAR